ncbi:MAG: rhodanese-like domain-containing protein [Acetivibrio sp.]
MAFSVVSAKEIVSYLGKEGTILVDLREKKEYEKEHINRAVNIPYDSFDLRKNELSEYKVIILYCERGNASLLAAREHNNSKQLILTLAGGFNRNKSKFIIDEGR